MAVYLKQFSTHAEYDAYINGSGAILPNVSICTTEGDVHYNPFVEPVETRVVATYNVTDTSNPTKIGFNQFVSAFSAIEIDGVEQPTVVSAYTFSTTGEHTVKYTLTNPTSIGGWAFYYCSNLTNIVIPDSVISIGSSAFQNCGSLTSIEIPSGVTSIGSSAFNGCYKLTRLNSDTDGVFNIPSGVTSIGNSTFQNCSKLTSIEIPSGVTSIGDSAFGYCGNLTSIVIPDSVTSIGSYAFNSGTSITSITIGASVTSIGDYAFQICTSLTSITSLRTAAPTIKNSTFYNVKSYGTLYVPIGSSGYDTWMQNTSYYLGQRHWTKIEQ